MSSAQRKFLRRGAQPAPNPPPLRHDYERDKAAVAWCMQENNPHDPFVVNPAAILAAAEQLSCSAKEATGLVEHMRRVLREVEDLGLHELDILSKWYSQGMPTLDIEEKLAASLLATNAGALEDQLRPPFDSVLVRVPGGLCGPVESVRVSRRNDVWFFCCNTAEDLHLWTVSSEHLDQLKASLSIATDESDEETEAFPDEEDDEERAKRSAHRLAINALLMMEHRREAVSSRREKTTNHKRRRGPPSRYFFTLTAPVVHDMRSVVREYIAHGGKSPTVQCVVAGHWKMQPCGPGKSERKRIFIEPYWRGPEDAPIAIRPHVLKQ